MALRAICRGVGGVINIVFNKVKDLAFAGYRKIDYLCGM
jgi:hypothetical protein